MNKEQFNKVKELFDEAIFLPAAKREKFLDEKCGTDSELKTEVITLLQSLEDSNDFLEEPLAISDSSLESFQDSNIGRQIGKYLIDGEAGEGGMGIVYSGKRNDKEFDQRVAIKILKRGISSEYHLKRFQIERQTLANLQHQNIARLIDGGKTEDGLPYLVMEFIDGIPITEYCNQKKLGINERLRLFHKICSAVQYAHRNLIIHRDIKPGNILVNEDGSPKLLDFGIAKLVDEDLSENSEGLTRTGVWHLTPEYSSPEQIKGEKITTASDIYSLGVLFYEILTGEQPYRITSISPVAISKIITEENVLKPSEKVKQTSATKSSLDKKYYYSQNPEKTFSQLKGDLDNIVFKAMHKDPDQRYSSVQDFMNDIEKYLNGLPVTARKDTINYRASKFIRRHKVGVAIFILGNLFLIGGIAAIIYQGNIAAHERDRAQTELTKFEEINSFLLEMLSSADPGVDSKDVKVYDILDKAAKDVETELRNQPEVKAAIKQTLGSTFIGLGEYDKAEKLLLESLESNKKIFGFYSKEVAKSSHQLGLCYDWIGNFPLADSFYNQGISIYKKIYSEPIKDLADNLNDYGSYLTNMGLYDSSSVVFKDALKIYRLHNKEKTQKEAITINNLAVNLHYQKKVVEAEKYYLEALEILTKLYGPNRPEIGSIYNNLAYIYLDNKDFKASEKAFQKSYEIKVALLGKDHPNVGLAFVNLGMLYFTEKEYVKAEKSLLQSIELFNRTKAHKDPILALGYYWLGCVYLESNKLAKAEKELKNSLQIREEIYPKNNYRIWSTRGELGICYLKQKKYKAAEKLLNETLQFFKNDKFRDLKKITRYTEYSAILYEKIGKKSLADFYQNELEKLNQETPSLR